MTKYPAIFFLRQTIFSLQEKCISCKILHEECNCLQDNVVIKIRLAFDSLGHFCVITSVGLFFIFANNFKAKFVRERNATKIVDQFVDHLSPSHFRSEVVCLTASTFCIFSKRMFFPEMRCFCIKLLLHWLYFAAQNFTIS